MMVEEIIKSLIRSSEQKGLKFSSNIKSNVDTSLGRGKDYPGFKPLLTYRALAWNSTVVYSIIIFRRNQVLKKEKLIVPYNNSEPPFKFNILEYSPESLMYLPSIDEADVFYVINILRKYKLSYEDSAITKINEIRKKISPREKEVLQHIEEKHVNYYLQRIRDAKKILDFLERPDPIFSEENSWSYLLSMILDDILTIDRGAILKIRDERGKLIAITPVDGTTIKPVLNENTGIVEYYVQEVDGAIVNDRIDKKDVILFRQNLTPDVYMYGYSIPPIEILYKVILSDIFIDKGNLDYYRKGGSIPEGIITVEPPSYKEGDVYPQLSREQLESIQRQLQAIMMGDYTQVPILSGGKFSWIDFKGKRRDMQFKELAEFVARKICAIYQVSPQDVGILEGTNKATAEVLASMTKAKGLEPLMQTISKGMDSVIEEFRSEKDIKLWFKEDDIEKERDWWNIIQGQLNTGFRTINEARMEKGLEPVPWGDVPFSGLRNWKPEENQPKGIPGLPNLPSMSTGGEGLGGLGSQMPAGISGEAGQQQEKDEQHRGLDLLKQLFKSLDFSGNETLKSTIELVNDENYLNDEEVLKRVLEKIGLTSVVNFIENDNQEKVEIDTKDLILMNYRSKIKDETVYTNKSGNFVIRLFANEHIGTKEILEIISLHFDCFSVPKISFIDYKDGKKKAIVNVSACSPIKLSEPYTGLDYINHSLFNYVDEIKGKTKIEVLEFVFDKESFDNFNIDEINLMSYALKVPQEYKKKNYDKLLLSGISGDEVLLIQYEPFSTEKISELREQLLINGFDLSENIEFISPYQLYIIKKLIKEKSPIKNLRVILDAPDASGFGFIRNLIFGELISINEKDESILKRLISCGICNLYEAFEENNLEEVFKSISYFIETLSEDEEFEVIRFNGLISYLLYEFSKEEIKSCVFFEKNYLEHVHELSSQTNNIFEQEMFYKVLLGEQLDNENQRNIVKSLWQTIRQKTMENI